MTSATPTAATEAAALTGGRTTALCLSLAGVELRVESDDPDLLARARAWAGGFPGGSDGDRFVIHATRRAGVRPPLELMRRDVERAPAHRWDGSTLRVDGATFTAAADLARREAWLEGPAVLYPLEILVRHLLPALVEDGLVVHGALLVDDGRAWIASGPSGSGKSTLAALFPRRALCDERCAVRRDADGPSAWSLPYWRGRQGSARLAGVHLLRHGTSAERRRLGPAEAIPRLIREIQFPEHHPSALATAFDLLAELADRVPIWELSFAPDRSVWPVLSAEFGAS